jgi:hypothetical protein
MDLRFVDHPGFHRSSVALVATSTLAGAALGVLPPLAYDAPDLAREPDTVLVLALVAAALALGKSFGRIPARVGLALAAGLWLWFSRGAGWGVSALGFAGFAAAALAVGPSRHWLGRVLSAVVIVAAAWAASRVAGAEELVNWPRGLRLAVAGLGFGLVALAALVPAHVLAVIDPIAPLRRALPVDMDPELSGLCQRTVGIWQVSRGKMAADDPSMPLLRDGVARVLESARRVVESQARQPHEPSLDERIVALDQRLAATSDEATGEQYRAARAALDEQKRLHRRRRQGRERVVATLHHHVATLERFYLAAISLEDSRHGASADRRQLAELASDMATSGEALDELDTPTPVAAN